MPPAAQHTLEKTDVINTRTSGLCFAILLARSWPDIFPGISRSVNTRGMSSHPFRISQAASPVVALTQRKPNERRGASESRMTIGSSSITRTR